MSAETKAKAEEKRALIEPKVGCPKKWQDYSQLVYNTGDTKVNGGICPLS